MDTITDFQIKQKKYMPIFPKVNGKPTVFIEGYPGKEDEPMALTDFHAEQIITLSDQLKRYFAINELVHIGVDSFIYYREGDITKCVAPNIYIVFGVDKYPLRRSFYTWEEGAVPVTVIEFLSDSSTNHDRHKKVDLYLNDIGIQEYFIHQPKLKKSPEFRGWKRSTSGNIIEIDSDAEGSLFSAGLNLWFRWEEQQESHVRLLRPYLPDGTPIATSLEEQHLKEAAEARLEEEALLREEETQRRLAAEARVEEEVRRKIELETEVERLRKQLANRQNDN